MVAHLHRRAGDTHDCAAVAKTRIVCVSGIPHRGVGAVVALAIPIANRDEHGHCFLLAVVRPSLALAALHVLPEVPVVAGELAGHGATRDRLERAPPPP